MNGSPDERGTLKTPLKSSASSQPSPSVTPLSLAGEQRDQQRARGLGFTTTQEYASWLWPATFFEDEMGRPMWKRVRGDEAPILDQGNWIATYCVPVMNAGAALTVAVTAAGPSIAWTTLAQILRPGHIVLFSGTSWNNPSQHVNHSAIATGRADEISQKWWDHDLQTEMAAAMQRNRTVRPHPVVPAEALLKKYQGREYPVTRSRISDLAKLFALPATGSSPLERYFVDAFSVFEIRDRTFAIEEDIAALALP